MGIIPSCICISISGYFKGMVHAGIGETQLNNLLSAMNVHCINHKTLKERENEIEKVIEDVVSVSEEKFLLEEVSKPSSIDTGKIYEKLVHLI